MSSNILKGALDNIVSRHSNFDFDTFVANTPVDEYDVWNDYCLPMHYSDPVQEYQALRNSCAVFDASPMRKFRIKGPDAGKFLDRMLTAPVSQAPLMRASYGLICTEQGFLLDDGILIKLTEEDYFFLITDKDTHIYFNDLRDGENVETTDETADWYGLAIQGPKSCAVLKQFGFDDVEQLAPFEIKYYELAGEKILVGRLGFTGDLGYEIWFAPELKDLVLEHIIKAEQVLQIDILGYGLTVVQICRIQAGMIVPGWDTVGAFEDDADERTPFELTLGWNVKLMTEQNFVGKDALVAAKHNGPRFKMKGITIKGHCDVEEQQPLFTIIDAVETQVGIMPSCIWNESADEWIGFASLQSAYGELKQVYVKDNSTGHHCDAVLGRSVFVDIEHRNQHPAPC